MESAYLSLHNNYQILQTIADVAAFCVPVATYAEYDKFLGYACNSHYNNAK